MVQIGIDNRGRPLYQVSSHMRCADVHTCTIQLHVLGRLPFSLLISRTHDSNCRSTEGLFLELVLQPRLTQHVVCYAYYLPKACFCCNTGTQFAATRRHKLLQQPGLQHHSRIGLDSKTSASRKVQGRVDALPVRTAAPLTQWCRCLSVSDVAP